VDQAAAEPVPAHNPDVAPRHEWMRAPGRRILMERSVSVALIGVVAEDQPRVPFADDQRPVQALAADAGDPPRCPRPSRPTTQVSRVGRR
jgi:hypothetical protein